MSKKLPSCNTYRYIFTITMSIQNSRKYGKQKCKCSFMPWRDERETISLLSNLLLQTKKSVLLLVFSKCPHTCTRTYMYSAVTRTGIVCTRIFINFRVLHTRIFSYRDADISNFPRIIRVCTRSVVWCGHQIRAITSWVNIASTIDGRLARLPN